MMDFTKLQEKLIPKPDGESPVRHRTGTVDAVNANGTVDLDLGGTVVPDVSVLAGSSVTVGQVVQVLVWAGDLLVIGGIGGPGYTLAETVYFTSSGTFTKADYPGLRAIRVRMVGGGGGGSGCAAASSATTASIGGSGWGAGYAESFILAADLDTTEAVTVGAAGSGGSAGANDGSAGEDSVFDTISGEVRAVGGPGGTNRAAPGSGHLYTMDEAAPPEGTGDVVIAGGQPGPIVRNDGNSAGNGPGGDSMLGHGARGRGQASPGTGFLANVGFGGGGGGGYDRNTGGNLARAGGNGRAGIVIVEVYV